MTQVVYGNTRIDINPSDTSRLLAAIAVASNCLNPKLALNEAIKRLSEFEAERHSLFAGSNPSSNESSCLQLQKGQK